MPDSPIPELLRALAEEFAVLLERMPAAEQEKINRKRKLKMPDSEEAKALHEAWKRLPNTMWQECEIRAFLQARDTGNLTLANIELVSRYREIELKKGEKGYCRKGLEAALNNWNSEVDKANACPEIRRLQKAKEKEEKIIPMPAPDEAAAAKMRAAAAAGELSRAVK